MNIHHFCNQFSLWNCTAVLETTWQLCADSQCVIFVLCLSFASTIARLKGHLNHTLTSVGFPQTGEFQERKLLCLKRHASHYMSFLLITVHSRVSVVPLHPGAKLSDGCQWKPCQNSVWATALKVTDKKITTTGTCLSWQKHYWILQTGVSLYS